MKQLITVIFLVAAIPAFSQDTILKKANTIIVKGVTLTQAANALLDRQFIIAKKDNELQTLNSEARRPPKTGAYMKIFVRVKDSAAIITGRWFVTSGNPDLISNSDYLPIDNRGMKGSPIRETWNELNAFALSFNKPVEYLIK